MTRIDMIDEATRNYEGRRTKDGRPYLSTLNRRFMPARITGSERDASYKRVRGRKTGYAREIEELAQFLVRDFHDWSAQGQYFLEPGFRDLVGRSNKTISVHYLALRDDWEDDCRRALDAWERLGFEFEEGDDPLTVDVVVDDEKRGAFALRRMGYVGRHQDGKPVVHSVAREINIWKEWPEWQLYHAMVHEIGHVLGLGHPGPYNAQRPPQANPHDTAKNSVMSYYGRGKGVIGDADRLAIDMIYGD